MIRHEDQRPVVCLEREADVSLGAAIWAHRRPFTRGKHESAPELRSLKGATRHADNGYPLKAGHLYTTTVSGF